MVANGGEPQRKRDWAQLAVTLAIPVMLVLVMPLLATLAYFHEQALDRTYEAQIQACERGNLLRERLNTLSEQNEQTYARAAEVLRQLGTTPAADALAIILHRSSTGLQKFPIPVCEEIIPRP